MKKNVLIIVLLILVVIFLGSLFIVPNMTSIIKFGGTISSLIASALAARWSGLFPWLKGLVTDKSKRAEVERDITVLEDKRKERRAEKAQAQAQKAQAQEDQLKEDLVELEKNCRSILKERFRDPEPAIPGYAATVDRDYIERHFAKDFSISVGRGMYDATYLIRRDQRQTEHIVIKRAVVFNTNTLIIGDKGSGKTFYLKRLEWEALFQDGGIRAFPGVKYPIYVDFQQFAHSAV